MNECVLDASVVIALLKREAGWEGVVPLLETGSISAVNYSEVAAWLARFATLRDEVASRLATLNLKVSDFDSRQAIATAMLRPKTARRGLSLGDRACLALASELGVPAITADRPWSGLDLGIEIRFMR